MKTLSILLLFTAFLCIHSLNADTIYVDAANVSGIEDGTAQHPFNTIKEGITVATAGDTVMIRPGTYVPDDSWSGNDHTLLLKAGVMLIGENSATTIIAGIIVDQQFSNLSIGLEKLKFDEFHFIRATQAGPFAGKNIIWNCSTTLISPGFGAGVPVNDTTPGPNFGFLIENNDLGSEGTIEFKQGAGVSELTVRGNTCGYIQLKSGGGYTYRIENNDVSYGILDKSAANPTTISKAVAQAKAEHKHVLIQWGGNWCPWCLRFHALAKGDVHLDSLLKKDFLYILANVPHEKEKRDMALYGEYGFPNRFGFPVFVILDGNGKQLHIQDSGLLEHNKVPGYDTAKVENFLKMWTVKAVDPATYTKKK